MDLISFQFVNNILKTCIGSEQAAVHPGFFWFVNEIIKKCTDSEQVVVGLTPVSFSAKSLWNVSILGGLS